MRTTKTALQVFLGDIKSFLKLFIHPNMRYLYTLIAVFTASVWLGTTLQTVYDLSPGDASGIGAIIICGVAGITYWVYTVIKRAKHQVKQENRKMLKALGGKSSGPKADWID